MSQIGLWTISPVLRASIQAPSHFQIQRITASKRKEKNVISVIKLIKYLFYIKNLKLSQQLEFLDLFCFYLAHSKSYQVHMLIFLYRIPLQNHSI